MWKIEHTPCCSTWIRWLLLNEFRYFPCMTSKYWHCPWQIWQPLIDMRLNRLELVPPISASCAYVINFKCSAVESGWDSPRHNCQACRLSPVRTASLVLRPSSFCRAINDSTLRLIPLHAADVFAIILLSKYSECVRWFFSGRIAWITFAFVKDKHNA